MINKSIIHDHGFYNLSTLCFHWHRCLAGAADSMLILSDNLFVSLERNTNANETKMDKQTNIQFQVHGTNLKFEDERRGTFAEYCRAFCFSYPIEDRHLI